jgi:uncharacterized membrane protein YcaP (DUF421 family)
VIKDGRILCKNLRQELIADEESMSLLRQQGIENVAQVKKCFLEGNGYISVIKTSSKDYKREPTKALSG